MTVFDPVVTTPDDHHPLVRLLADHGTWKQYSIGCICGFYDRGTPGKWFIPSEASAMRLYNEHLKIALNLPEEPDEDEPESWPVREPFDLTGAFV